MLQKERLAPLLSLMAITYFFLQTELTAYCYEQPCCHYVILSRPLAVLRTGYRPFTIMSSKTEVIRRLRF